MPDQRSRRPLIIPVFIPNQGCHHRCIFCEQEKITAQQVRPVSADTVREVVERAVRSPGFDSRRSAEVAFYGGTFTGLPEEKMVELLRAVGPYIEAGHIQSLRASTRPDAIHAKALHLMRRWGVSTVELGVQSMDNRVLDLSGRGHRAEETSRAVTLLKEYGFKVGIQLMPGLPGDSHAVFMKTVDEVLALHPDMVRLYPVLVIRGTELARLFRVGAYRPLDLDEAVGTCAESCVRFEREGIPVIRIGLMSSSSLRDPGMILAGPWHEAFGFLVRSEIYHRGIASSLPGMGEAERIRLLVHWREMSLLRGHRNRGLRLIEQKTGAIVEQVRPHEALGPGEIRVEIL